MFARICVFALTIFLVPSVISANKYGDVSGDGEIHAYDATLVYLYVKGEISFTSAQRKVADVSGNGGISNYDARLILKHVAWIITEFPVERKERQKSFWKARLNRRNPHYYHYRMWYFPYSLWYWGW